MGTATLHSLEVSLYKKGEWTMWYTVLYLNSEHSKFYNIYNMYYPSCRGTNTDPIHCVWP